MPKSIEIQVTIISPNKTYVSGFYTFENQLSKETIKSFEINLKNIINKIKEYIKNNDEEFNDG